MMRIHILLLNSFVFVAAVQADITTLSPSNLDFGSQVVTTTSAVLPVVLSNTTKKDLNISGLTITGDFTLTAALCALLPAGQTCTTYVAFAPTVAGLRIGLLSVYDDANNSPQKVKLSGTGIPVQMTSITVAPSKPTVALGLNMAFTATGNFNNGTTQDLTGSATWTSSANGIATIAPGGLASSVHQGTTTVTATSGMLSGSTVLTVGPPLLLSLSVTYPSSSTGAIAQGMTLQFTASGTFSDHTIQDISSSVQWSSSNPSVAAINATGLVTGKSPGVSTIAASSGSAGAGSGVIVKPPALTSIEITPANPSIAVGTSLQFIATGTFTDGSTQNITDSAQWSTLSAAAISATGLATAENLGVTTVMAVGPGFNNGSLGTPAVVGQTTLGVGDAFNSDSPMSAVRFFHTATLVNGGRALLLAGGAPTLSGSPVSSVELYDPVAKTFTPGGSMTSPRLRHTATLLASGKVLMAGGSSGGPFGVTGSAEVYDPTTQSFSPTGSMGTARSDQTATLLLNGQVLIAGGYTNTAELYDPVAGAFTPTGSMAISRRGNTATLLGDGRVLITGGLDGNGGSTTSAELYDPATGLFSTAGNMAGARAFHRATLLNGGKVLLTGGFSGFIRTAQAEIYDPVTGLFNSTGVMNIPRDTHTATLLASGQVLIVGGEGAPGILATAEKYDPAVGTFSLTGATNNVHYDPTRLGHTTTLLYNGEELVAGGSVGTGTGVYEPRIPTPPGLMGVAVAPAGASISVGASQRFIATGTFQDGSVLVLASVIWVSTNSAVATIGNDVGSQGLAASTGLGTSFIGALAGPFVAEGSATLTVH